MGGTRTHDTLLSTQGALPTELPGQLSMQGSKSTIQHNTRQSQTPCTHTHTHSCMHTHRYTHRTHSHIRDGERERKGDGVVYSFVF